MSRIYEIDGKDYVSVTSVCELLSKPGLYWFYIRCTILFIFKFCSKLSNLFKTKPSEETIKSLVSDSMKHAKAIAYSATSLGTGVHEYINEYYSKTLRGMLKSRDKGFKKALENFHEFDKVVKPKAVLLEKVVYSHKKKFAGTLDAVLLAGNKLVLNDWKTSTSIYPDYELQGVAYHYALTEMIKDGILKLDGNIEEIWITRFDKEKDFKLTRDIRKIEVNSKLYKLSLKAFFGLLDTYNWQKQRRKRNDK